MITGSSSSSSSMNTTSSSSSLVGVPRGPWHSPVPYLFGGLAVMLGLIAFALLILACSYWKLSEFLDDDQERRQTQRDLESGDDDKAGDSIKPPAPSLLFEEKIAVIMAGDEKPTFLATPIISYSNPDLSLGDDNHHQNDQHNDKSNRINWKTETGHC